MSFPEMLMGWLPAVGGFVGIATIVYFGLMIHYTRKKDAAMRAVEIRLAKIEGLLIGGRRR